MAADGQVQYILSQSEMQTLEEGMVLRIGRDYTKTRADPR